MTELDKLRTALAAATERAETWKIAAKDLAKQRDTLRREAKRDMAYYHQLEDLLCHTTEEDPLSAARALLEKHRTVCAERDAHAETIRKLREVVAWYGDEENWAIKINESKRGVSSMIPAKADRDRGQRAPAALSDPGEAESEESGG